MNAAQPAANRRLLELDSLRGLAALGVVLYHYTVMHQTLLGHRGRLWFTFPKGQFGVNLFFMISGFVILMTLSRTKTTLDFVVSRFSRIYPAYWAAMLFTLSVVTVGGLWPEGRLSRSTVLVNATMLQKFVGMRSVDGVYWTLAFELLFYGLALGLFILGLLRRAELVSAGALLLSIAYSLASRADAFAALGPAGHLLKDGLILLLIFQNVQYFVTGMLLHRCWKEGVTASRVALIVVSVVTTLIVEGRFMAEMQTILVVVMAVAISGKAGVLRSGPLVFLGSISYTLYLTHQDAGYVMIHALETRGVSANLAIPVTILAAVAVASLMTALVEQPAMALIRRRYKAFTNHRATRTQLAAALPAD